MIKEIVKDQFQLSQKSTIATKEDLDVITDLLDTIKANHDHCVLPVTVLSVEGVVVF